MFDEVRLPTGIERGSVGGPSFLTTISTLNSGKEQRNQLWERDKGRWDIGYGIQTREDALLVRNFFMARRGRARGFRFRDWTNYTTLAVEQPAGDQAGTADGVETTFQLRYRYIDAGNFYYEKPIFKPVAGTVAVFRDGVQAMSGWTVNTATGIITFSVAPTYGTDVTWTGEFDLPVRFDSDTLDMVLTNVEVISQPAIPIVELKL